MMNRPLMNNNASPFSMNKDVEIEGSSVGITDTISQLKWAPNALFLSSTSWDGSLKVWEVSMMGETAGKIQMSFGKPVLCQDWHDSGAQIFVGGTATTNPGNSGIGTGCVYMCDLATNTQSVFAQHDTPVRDCQWLANKGILMVSGFDNKVRYWDLRQKTMVMEVNLPDRVLASAIRDDIGVFATADNGLNSYNLNNPGTAFNRYESPISQPIRTVTCFGNSRPGYLYGCAGGRANVHYYASANNSSQMNNNQMNSNSMFGTNSNINTSQSSGEFTDLNFKCHRESPAPAYSARKPSKAYTVNTTDFHPLYSDIILTSGSDGQIAFWNLKIKKKVKTLSAPKYNQSVLAPITATALSHNASLLAYATGYDWSMGYEHYDKTVYTPKLLIHKYDPNSNPK